LMLKPVAPVVRCGGLQEFIAATMHLNKLENEENLYKTFQEFDKDGSGYIDEGELKLALKKFGMPIDDDEVKNMIQEVDVNSDGRISYDEFQLMMRAKIHKNDKPTRGRLQFTSE
jgi:calcium-dependent protein kinase